jgi:hypothetical protein
MSRLRVCSVRLRKELLTPSLQFDTTLGLTFICARAHEQDEEKVSSQDQAANPGVSPQDRRRMPPKDIEIEPLEPDSDYHREGDASQITRPQMVPNIVRNFWR